MIPSVRRLLRLDRATIVLLTTVAVLATVVGITVASPPDAVRPADVDGRTWMSVPTGDGPGLVLLNGFSGLVEARARAGGDLPPGTRFAASGPDATLLAGPDGVVVVDDGLHDARPVHVPTQGAVLVGDDVLVVDPDGAVSIQRPDEEPTALHLDGDDAIGEPLLDDDGAAWLLTEHAAGHRAWRVGDDLEPTTREVPPTTTSLAVVDGEVVAVTRTGVVAVSGGSDRPAPGGATVPTVAIGAGDAWAHAEGAQVTVIDGDETSGVSLEDPVEQLVVWSGAVLAITADGVHRVEDGETTPVGEFDDAPRVHTDGGLLWLTSRNRVTAVWDDQTEVTFELAAIDLDLCVGDCEADDVRQFLEEQEDQEPSERTTTTTTPDRRSSPSTTRDIRPPSVEPTVPTTTTTSTTTTTRPTTTTEATTTTSEPARSGDDGRTASPAPRETTTTTQAPPPPAPNPPPATAPPTTRAPLLPPLLPGPRDPGPGGPGPGGPGPGPGRPPQDPGPAPTQPPPTQATTTTTAAETTSTTEPTTTTTTPPEGSVGLILGVDRSGDGATATVGIEGRAVDCGALVSRSTAGTVSWSGAASGSRQVTLRWRGVGATSTDTETVPITGIGAGPLTVSFSACGVQTSRTVGDPDAPPTVSTMSVSPAQPEVGETIQASVTVEERDGWSVSGASWSGGSCGAERNVGGNGLSQTFTADREGQFCISVVVTLAGPGGRTDQQSQSGSAQVVDTTTTTTTTEATTTTTTEATTTTTEATTTTTTEATTTTTESTTTTTESTTTTGDPSL